MAPSESQHLALFLAIVITAATLFPSAAAVPAKAPAPSASNDAVAKPLAWCMIPCLPILPPILCVPPIFCPPTPSAPPPPSPFKPHPKECLPSLMGLMPCKDFLTNSTAPKPPRQGKCCDGVRSLFQNFPICLCHVFNGGDLDKLMSAPIDGGQLFGLSSACNTSPSDFVPCYDVPPVRAAPTPKAAP
ncbi:non-specific lipid-transfer protein C6-like [Triticum dicoccoides]|nr:non-specific lipid-transfer protein C6-like [Triticum dicoccoides]XP_044429296.1 non-specific lipid-transfer protein C6-like [Triticum aestivum]